MKKSRLTVPKEKLIKFDIYDEAFSDLCDQIATRWAQKAEKLQRTTKKPGLLASD